MKGFILFGILLVSSISAAPSIQLSESKDSVKIGNFFSYYSLSYELLFCHAVFDFFLFLNGENDFGIEYGVV